jgi:transposase
MRAAGGLRFSGRLVPTKKEEALMAHESTTQQTCYPEEKKLYMALELSKAKWLVRCSSGGRKVHLEIVLPNDEERMAALVRRAKEKLGLGEEAKVVSCYEAGRDGFWPHRFLEKQGIENNVIDAASMKVSRHGRRAKSDGIDVRQLLNDLVRFDRGDDDVWRVVRVPSEEAEDDRRPHRELERLKKERTDHRNRGRPR